MIDGVNGKTKRVGKHNFEVRTDGFGTMTDEEVQQYKEARPRYNTEIVNARLLALEQRMEVIESPG